MINSKINKDILTLWHKYFDRYELGKTPVSKEEFDKVKAPMFYDEPKDGCILFIGINPSASTEKGTNIGNKIIKEKYPDIGDPEEYLSWRNFRAKENGVDMVVDFERTWIEKYQYFKKMREIGEAVGLKDNYFKHADIFLYRETKQPKFIKKVEVKRKQTEFGEEQLKIFDQVLNSMIPKVIVVANAKASEIFRQKYKDDLEFNSFVGFHYFKKKIPIFFSGMLSGQRALDKGSFERLKWHIKKAVSENK